VADGKGVVKKIAKERMAILYELAKQELHKDTTLSRDYIKTLRLISEHYKVRPDQHQKAQTCKHCDLPLIPGDNAETRVIAAQKRILYRCKSCGRANTLRFSSGPRS
jgi:ribonuclease P protein subunit RPR2